MKFQLGNMFFQPTDIIRHGLHRRVIAFIGGQVQQLTGIVETMCDAVQAFHEFGQTGAFAAQVLGALGVVPDIRVFQLAGYFLEAFAPDRVVKDTP